MSEYTRRRGWSEIYPDYGTVNDPLERDSRGATARLFSLPVGSGGSCKGEWCQVCYYPYVLLQFCLFFVRDRNRHIALENSVIVDGNGQLEPLYSLTTAKL